MVRGSTPGMNDWGFTFGLLRRCHRPPLTLSGSSDVSKIIGGITKCAPQLI